MARADELTRRRTGPRAAVLAACLSLAVLAHAALLVLGAGTLSDWRHAWLRDALPQQAAAAPPAVQVRHLPARPPDAAPAEVDSPAVTARLAGPAPEPPEMAVRPAHEPLSPDVPVAPETPAATSAVEPAVYVPRALLSIAPAPRAPVLLHWPANWPGRQSYTGILKLYLDERGRVERVEPDGDAVLPAPLFDAAREAFLAADFSAGQLDGRAVKSWMRVEVSFETAAPPVQTD